MSLEDDARLLRAGIRELNERLFVVEKKLAGLEVVEKTQGDHSYRMDCQHNLFMALEKLTKDVANRQDAHRLRLDDQEKRLGEHERWLETTDMRLLSLTEKKSDELPNPRYALGKPKSVLPVVDARRLLPGWGVGPDWVRVGATDDGRSVWLDPINDIFYIKGEKK